MFGPECFLQNIVDNLDICSKALQEWNTVQRGALKRMIKVKKHEFQMANDVSNFDEWQVLNKIEHELDNLLVTEEKYWRQRSQRPAACVSRFERWIPPNEGFVKVNFDAAIDISRGVVSLGWVVHDSEGFVLLSAVKPMMGGFSPEVAEALAVLTALQVARDFCFNRVILETDASTIVKLVNDATLPLSELGFIIQDIRLFFQNSNFLICVRNVRRSANRVTHCLAKFAFCRSATGLVRGLPFLCGRSHL
ncbi:hypothetical protein ACOSQ2_021544 [Xanthoceras sorbifolium]